MLAGHSLAGQELSSIGSRHPEKVSGLIYLDAAYPYAFYNRSRGHYQIDLNELRRRLAQLQAARETAETLRLTSQLLDTDLPAFERALRERQKQLQSASAAPRPAPAAPAAPFPAIAAGMQRYTDIRAPILAIYALPHTVPGPVAQDSLLLRIWSAAQAEWPAQADAFERAFPRHASYAYRTRITSCFDPMRRTFFARCGPLSAACLRQPKTSEQASRGAPCCRRGRSPR